MKRSLMILTACFGMACTHDHTAKSPWSMSSSDTGPWNTATKMNLPPKSSSYFDWCVQHDGRPKAEAEAACRKELDTPVKPKRAYHDYAITNGGFR